MPNNLRLLELIVFVCFSLLAMELYYHFDLQGGLLMLCLVVLDWVLMARAAEPTSEGDSAKNQITLLHVSFTQGPSKMFTMIVFQHDCICRYIFLSA